VAIANEDITGISPDAIAQITWNIAEWKRVTP